MVFTASLLGAQQNKPASLLDLSLDKTLNGMPPSLCDKTNGGAQQSTNRGGPNVTKELQTERKRYCDVTYIYIYIYIYIYRRETKQQSESYRREASERSNAIERYI